MAPPRKDVRRTRIAEDRRDRKLGQEPDDKKAAAPSQQPAYRLPPWWLYYPWQYGGLLLGCLAVAGTVYFYEQSEAEWMVYKLLACLGLALVSLAIHETRPFKRMGYGDAAREQGRGLDTLLVAGGAARVGAVHS